MIQVQPFTTDVLLTHKMFFILGKLPKNSTEIDVWIQTPVGLESVDFVNVYTLHDGTLLAAWKHPFEKLPLQNLTAFCDGVTQILNLYPLERIIDIYNRPVDAEFGTFIFTKSSPIDGGDWRCDRGMYGSRPFESESVSRVITDIGQVVYFEPFLSINSVGHLIYIESNSKSELANEKLNNSIVPTTGRTLQEVMRLIYEWSVLAKEPFNSPDEAATCANDFLSLLKFSDSEVELLESLPPMQVAQFLSGSETARVRPNNIPELTDEIKNIIFKRMGSSSLCALLKIHGIEDAYGLLELEQQELEAGIERFKQHYQIPTDWSILEWERIIEHCALYYHETIGAYVHNQLRLFNNKKVILEKVQNNAL